jgi:hypothetical protein
MPILVYIFNQQLQQPVQCNIGVWNMNFILQWQIVYWSHKSKFATPFQLLIEFFVPPLLPIK